MPNKTRNYEEPLNDDAEAEVEEEFRFDLQRARQNMLPRGVKKVYVSLFLDEDVMGFFKQLAEKAPATSSQTQINQALREVMMQKMSAEERTGKDSVTAILSDSHFIKLLDKRIKKALAGQKKTGSKPKRKAA